MTLKPLLSPVVTGLLHRAQVLVLVESTSYMQLVQKRDIQFLMPPISVASIRYKHIAEKSHHPTCDSYISDSNLATEAREDLCRLRTPSFMEEFNPMLTDMKGWWETHSQVLRDFDEKNITLLSQSEKIALSLLSRTFLPF